MRLALTPAFYKEGPRNMRVFWFSRGVYCVWLVMFLGETRGRNVFGFTNIPPGAWFSSMRWIVLMMLLAKANTEGQGHLSVIPLAAPEVSKLARETAVVPRQPAYAAMVPSVGYAPAHGYAHGYAPPAAGKLALSSAASLPVELLRAAQFGELHTIVEWLRKGGPVDALCRAPTHAHFGLLSTAATCGHLEIVTDRCTHARRMGTPRGEPLGG